MTWPTLSTPDKDRLITSPLTTDSGRVVIRLALDSSLEHHILLESTATAERESTRRGIIDVSTRNLDIEGARAMFVDVHCHRRDLHDLFTDVAAEIAAEAESSDASAEAIVQRVLDRWQQLLGTGLRTPLSQSEEIGLIGELLVLQRLVSISPTAFKAWTGPTGARFDFNVARAAIEVKTTGAQAREFTVHGLDQLDAPPDVKLHLVFIRLEAAAGGPVHLPALATDVAGLVSDSGAFWDRCAGAGYHPAQASLYTLTFRLRDFTMYEVLEGFPRITESSLKENALPPGIVDVSYRVSLEGASTSQVDDAVMVQALALLAAVG